MSNEQTGNPDFSFDMNLAGVQAAGIPGRELPTGFYKGRIMDAVAENAQSSGRPQVKMRIEVTTEDFAGVIRTTRLGIPSTPDDKVRFFWRAAMESVGYTPAQIDAGVVKVSAALLVGRECGFHYTQGDKDNGVYDNLRFLSPSAFDAGVKQLAASPGSALGGGGTRPAPTGVPGLGGAQGVPGLGGGLGGGLGAPSLGVPRVVPVVSAQAPAGGMNNAADLLKALGAR